MQKFITYLGILGIIIGTPTFNLVCSIFLTFMTARTRVLRFATQLVSDICPGFQCGRSGP